MSVKLRFRRMGRRKMPVYGLVATDSRSPRDGRFIEDLGRYEPVSEPAVVKLDAERIVYWLGQGAQPSDTVRNLLQKEGILLRWALTRRGEEAEAIEQEVAAFRERRSEAQPTTKTRAERRAEALDAERAKAKERAAEIAKERAEREAELRRQREEAEAAERAAAEEARAAAAADAADSAALTSAADATPPAESDATPPAAEGGAEAGGASETPEAVVEGEPVPQTSSQADGDDDTADRQADAEAEGGDAATAEAAATDVSDEAPDAAEEQPAVADAESEDVAADTGADVADQASAGAAQDVPAEQAEGLGTATEDVAAEAPTEEAPAAEAATPPAESAPAEGGAADDLTAISGVGPTYSGILADAGLTTFAAVAETSVDRLREVITEAGSSSAGNEETWPEQARLLAAGDAEGHAAYVEAQKTA